MRSRKPADPNLRTVDVARHAGCSVQQVRNLERDGVLPLATRTGTGYRVYDERHLRSVSAYRALADGAGPVEAKKIMRAVHAYPGSGPLSLLSLLDAAHARLDRERRELRLAQEAAATISGEPVDDVRPSDAMSVSELAGALGVRPSTLRHWDAEGLVVPRRASPRGPRRYFPDDVRDARVVHQLRMAGYRITPLRALIPELRRTRRWDEVAAALTSRQAVIEARSRALLDGVAALAPLLPPRGAPGCQSVPEPRPPEPEYQHQCQCPLLH